MTTQTILRTLIAASDSAWLAIAMKATLAMLATLLMIRFSRRASASLRHLVVAATFGAILFLPLAAMLMPSRVVTVPAPAPAPKKPDVPWSELAAPAQTVAHRPSINLMDLAVRIYIGGAMLLGASLLIGVWRVRRVHGQAEVSVRGTRLANEMASANGMGRGIEVAISPKLAVPITYGSVILLPGETKDWSEEELARAVRHELEHIARRDWATQIVSRLACALYWPHPFVWVLWRRLRLEAERACDDAVIRSYGAAEPYAEQLVSLARRLMGRGEVPALAMATRSNLGRRVEAILDGQLRRAPLTRLSSLTVAMVAAAVMLTVAPFKVMSATLGREQNRMQTADDADPFDMALLMAAERDDRQTMQRLLDRGASADAAIRGDGSPLIAAARKGHVEAMRMLIYAGANVNRGVEGDGNPLIAAACGGHLEAVRLLLDRGARIDEGVEGDGNALIMAAGAGYLEVVRDLLDRGASIEKTVNGDENALIHASETGQPAVVRYLIERGANVNARVWAEFGDGEESRGEWRTAMSMARRNGHQDVIAILRAAGAR